MTLAIALVTFGALAPPQDLPTQHLDHPDLALGTHTGWDVDVDGEWAVVGAYGQETFGAVHVYRFGPEGWAHHQTLDSPLPVQGGFFGYAVDVEGDLLVVGQPEVLQAPRHGRVFVFQRTGTTWAHTQTLTDPAPHDSDMFGVELSLGGDDLAVISKRTLDPLWDRPRGQVLMFERTTPWSFGHVGTLSAPLFATQYVTPGPGDLRTPHVEDGLLLVTEHHGGGAFVRTGERDAGGWHWVDEILDPGAPNSSATFGQALDKHGDRIAIGMPYWTSLDPAPPGRVRLYEQDASTGAWTFAGTVQPDAPQQSDHFGMDLEFGPGGLVVGAPGAGGPYADNGSIHWFRTDAQGTWEELGTYQRVPQTFQGGELGRAVAADFGTGQLVGGAWEATLPTLGLTGAAYAFDLSEGELVHPGVPSSTGEPVRLGVLRDAEDPLHPLTLALHDVPAGASGLFLTGLGDVPTPLGGGLLVTGQPLWRIFPTWLRPNGGHVILPLDPTQPSLAGALLPGRTWVFQAWYRDPAAGPNATNLSAARGVWFG